MFSPAKERLLDQNQASRTTRNQLLKEIQEDEQER